MYLVQIFHNVFLAIFLAYIAYQQLKLGKRQDHLDQLRLKHQLYDRRVKIYDSTIHFLSNVLRDPANIQLGDLNTFHRDTYQSAFLFGDEILQYMDEVHLKALILRKDHMPLTPSDPAEVTSQLQWFASQLKEARRKFGPYMEITEPKPSKKQGV